MTPYVHICQTNPDIWYRFRERNNASIEDSTHIHDVNRKIHVTDMYMYSVHTDDVTVKHSEMYGSSPRLRDTF